MGMGSLVNKFNMDAELLVRPSYLQIFDTVSLKLCRMVCEPRHLL